MTPEAQGSRDTRRALPEQEMEEEEEEGHRTTAWGWGWQRPSCRAHMTPWAPLRTHPSRRPRGFLFPHALLGNILGLRSEPCPAINNALVGGPLRRGSGLKGGVGRAQGREGVPETVPAMTGPLSHGGQCFPRVEGREQHPRLPLSTTAGPRGLSPRCG